MIPKMLSRSSRGRKRYASAQKAANGVKKTILRPQHPALSGVLLWIQHEMVGEVERVESINETKRMYNQPHADEAHTFFVGEGQWLVHNACDFWLTGDYVKLEAKVGCANL